jgi:hypothetical protein
MEGLGNFISSISTLLRQNPRTSEVEATRWVSRVLPVVNRCLIAGENELVVQTNVEAINAIFKLMVEEEQRKLIVLWLDVEHQKAAEAFSRGRLTALAALHAEAHRSIEVQTLIAKFLQQTVTGPSRIETRTNAMQSLGVLIELMPNKDVERLAAFSDVLIAGMSDYSNDQRGDVGNLLRLQSLETVEIFARKVASERRYNLWIDGLLSHVVKLAGERLTKVRHRAWNCLQAVWQPTIDGSRPAGDFKHQADISTEDYFKQLTALLLSDQLRYYVLIGLCSSIGGGTEDVSRACCSALTGWMNGLKESRSENVIEMVTECLLRYLEALKDAEDREVVPALEFSTFIIDEGFVHQLRLVGSPNEDLGIWVVLQRLSRSNISIERLSSLIRVYQSLLQIETLKQKSMDKLTRLLLHRYPRVSPWKYPKDLIANIDDRYGMPRQMQSA